MNTLQALQADEASAVVAAPVGGAYRQLVVMSGCQGACAALCLVAACAVAAGWTTAAAFAWLALGALSLLAMAQHTAVHCLQQALPSGQAPRASGKKASRKHGAG